MNFTPEEKARITEPSDYILMEAAMCAWEHLLATHTDGFEELNGAGQARMCCASLAPNIHIAYCIAQPNLDGYAYDWEFVPWFLDHCVIWDTEAAYIHGKPELTPDWIQQCRRFGQPTDEDLLRECLRVFNELPNQVFSSGDTYGLAKAIDRRLKS